MDEASALRDAPRRPRVGVPGACACAWSEMRHRSSRAAYLALSKGSAKEAVEHLQALRQDTLTAHRHYFRLGSHTTFGALLDAGRTDQGGGDLYSVVKLARRRAFTERYCDFRTAKIG